MNDKHMLIRDTVDFSSEIDMPLDSNASVDGRAVTAECAEYDLRKAAAKPVSLKAARRGLTQSRNSAFSAVINHLIFRRCLDYVSIVATMKKLGIRKLYSFDGVFDRIGWIGRLE